MAYVPSQKLYSYEGPVKEFDTCVRSKWKATTRAVSEQRARCNLEYRYKQETGRSRDAKISLPGKIVLVNEGGTYNG